MGADIPAVVGTDGSWRLGPLTGRSTKPVAQYVGATARAAERARRLAELDARIAALAATRDAARDAETAAREARAAIEAWLTGVPSTSALLTAWTRLDERERVTAQADRRAAEAEEVAVQARVAEAGRRRDLAELAAAHDLPMDAVGLAARRERLRSLDDALSRHADAAAPLRAALLRWADDAERASAEADEAQEAAGTAIAAQERADTARAAADELEATVGASLREIQQRIAAAEQRAGELERRERELTGRIGSLLTATGAAEEAARNAALRLAEQEPALAAAVAALAAVDTVPGLLPSGLGEPSSGEAGPTTADNAATFDLARGFSTGSPVPASVLALARSLAELSPPPRQGTEAALFAAWQDAVSGPAGDREPRVIELGGALAVVGRDDTGEHPIGTLATRLAAAVTRDAELLTERERRLFEEHVLGDLGESLRARRQEAEELVAEMNQLLRGVTTSQGIAVQLRWTLRDDVLIKHEDDRHRTISLDVDMPRGNLRDLLTLAMKGESFMEGQIALRTKINLPPLSGKVKEKLMLDGQFEITNGKFLRSTIQDQIDTLSRRGQGQPKNLEIDEVIHGMAGTFKMEDETIVFRNLSFAVPGSGVDLAGSYDLAQDTLDFHGTLKLDAKVSQTMTGWKRWLAKPIDPFFSKDGAGTLLHIQVSGTSKEPKFGRDKTPQDK